jgi:hypothetical protein
MKMSNLLEALLCVWAGIMYLCRYYSKQRGGNFMDIIIERGCSLDVHRRTITACIMGTGLKKEIRTFTTMTNDLFRLKNWLRESGITHVAMERFFIP